ncbi:GMC family oxidoreductase N-terminal domain-containing protein [Caulobacter segnis]
MTAGGSPGCAGWGWDDVAPYFRRAEHQERGPCDWHATRRAAGTSRTSPPGTGLGRGDRGLHEQAGIPHVTTTSAAARRRRGRPHYQLTVRNGQRCSAAVAYLHPAMTRPNLKVETNALAGRILFEGRRLPASSSTRTASSAWS